MATTSITFRMDEKLKMQAELPFEIKEDLFYSEENQRHLKKAVADLEAGKGQIHDLIEADDE